MSFQSSGYVFNVSVALNIGPRCGTNSSLACTYIVFRIVPDCVAVRGHLSQPIPCEGPKDTQGFQDDRTAVRLLKKCRDK